MMAEGKKYRFRPRLIYSLRQRLMLMSFVVILLPMLLVAWSLHNLLEQHIARDVRGRLQSDVSAASLYYQAQVDRIRSSIHTVALDNTVKTTLRLDILGQLQEHLEQLAVQHQLDFLLIVDPEGYFKLSHLSLNIADIDLAEVDLSEHPLIASVGRSGVTAGSFLEEDISLLYLLEHEGKDIDFKPVVLIEAAAPITLRDQVLGIVLGGVMVTDNPELVQGIQAAAGGDRVEIVAADRLAAGSDIFERTSGSRKVRFSGQLNYENHRSPGVDKVIISPFDQAEMVYDYQPLTMPGVEPELALVLQQPMAELYLLINNLRRVLFWVFGTAMLLALIAVVFMSRSIARPLHEINRAMQKMRRGEVVEPLECRRDDEIGDLTIGFNDMALSLEARIRELGGEISSRQQAEKMLAAESERLRVTLQSMGDAVLATDTGGLVVLMNRVAEELIGRSRDECLGRPLHEILRATSQGGDGAEVDLLTWIQDGDKEQPAARDLQLQDGGKRVVTVRGCRIIDNSRQAVGAVLVIRDVTGQRRMKEELARGQKLESVGVLAGGIAHDFNNLLTAILGNLSLARMVSSTDDAHYRNIEDAEKASLRARELTQQLLTFSRGGSPVKDSVNLNELVRESAGFIAHGSNVQLCFTAVDDLWPVQVDRGQIGQVIDNLVINSIQAMPGGGVVDISLENYFPGKYPLLPLTGKRYVRIGVRDHGRGIDKEHLARIFDPYFTTKEVGNGLGLAICFSIVDKHDGHITVESELGKGTMFYVYLPALAPGMVLAEKEEVEQALPGTDFEHRVLVMDDEEIICSVVSQMLELLGYDAEISSDGEKALQMYTRAMEQGLRYDVVIMDLTIPGGMGGVEAVARLLEIDPAARVVVSSGYSSHEAMANYKEYGFAGVVAKPFRISDLERVLKEVVEG